MRIAGLIWIGGLLAQLSAQAQETRPFRNDSVRFESKDKTIAFGGTLSVPSHTPGQQVPAIVIVSGSGPQDQDGTMAGHKQFKAIADYLAARGVAVLRTDDRGVGGTTGTYEQATTADFADDALAAVDFLQSKKEIDPERIGLLGHSEGGAAIAIAAAKSQQVKYLISLAGLAMSGYDALVKQNEDLVNHYNMPEHNKKRSHTINGLMFKTALQYADSANMEEQLTATFWKWYRQDSLEYATTYKEPDRFRFPLYGYLSSATGPWYRYFVKYDARKVMSRIRVPVLALNGDKDLMVAYKENLENWKAFPAIGGNHNVTTMVLPGVNHIFLPCVTCDLQEYATIQAPFSTVALEEIWKWLRQFGNRWGGITNGIMQEYKRRKPEE